MAAPAPGAKQRRRFPGISPLAWQHPADLEAMEAVKRIPALDQVMKKASEHWLEKAFLVESVGSRIRLGPNQAPRIWELFREASSILDLPSVPQAFLATTGPGAVNGPNAFAFGMKEYTVTITSALVDLMTEDELLAVIGHELSHIKCEHMLYRTLATVLTQLSRTVLTGVLGLGRVATLPLQLALLAWSRRAELSCDRGGLLVVQDPAVIGSALAKLAGMSRNMMDQLDMNEVYRQAEEYEKTFDEQAVTKAYKYLKTINATHPAPIWRAKQIADWAKTDAYRQIMAGHYLTMRQAPGSSPTAARPDTGAKTTCAACGHAMDPMFTFCPSCGTGVDEALMPCPSCGEQVEEGWKTCPHCQAKIP